MKITYAQIKNPMFAKALGKLAVHGGFTDYKILANIKFILKQFERLVEEAQSEWVIELKKYADLDADGKFIPNEEVNPQTGVAVKIEGTFRIPKEKEEAFRAAEALFNTKYTAIHAEPLHFDAVKGVGFSANDLIQLEGIVLE